jgi:predicted HicB family RNase H-like nuclease
MRILMNQKKSLSRITLDIPSEDHKQLKVIAAITGKSMRELIIEALRDHLKETKMSIMRDREGL